MPPQKKLAVAGAGSARPTKAVARAPKPARAAATTAAAASTASKATKSGAKAKAAPRSTASGSSGGGGGAASARAKASPAPSAKEDVIGDEDSWSNESEDPTSEDLDFIAPDDDDENASTSAADALGSDEEVDESQLTEAEREELRVVREHYNMLERMRRGRLGGAPK